MKTTAKIPRHRSTWGQKTKKRKFETHYSYHVEATIWNECGFSDDLDELLFINRITLFGLYGIFVRASDWKWRRETRIVRLRMRVKWT